MRDILHNPIAIEDTLKFKCEDCGIELPAESCVGLPVVEVPGVGFIPDFDMAGHIKCTSPAAEGARSQAEGISEITVAEPELKGGETKKPARRVSDVEKMANRAGFQNFLAMREMTKLREDG